MQAAVVTLSSMPCVAPSSSLPLPHGKTTHKQAISDLQPDDPALRNKMDQAPASSQGEDAALTRLGGDEESKRRRMEQRMVDASGVCSQESEEVTTSRAIISRAMKGLVGFQYQAEYSSGDVLSAYLISGMTNVVPMIDSLGSLALVCCGICGIWSHLV